MSSSTQRRLTIETALTVPPSRLTLNNREYLTSPAVLIVEGVLNGAYIPAESLIANDWNGFPVVVSHPRGTDGTPVSARSPDVLATCGVGHLYRACLGTGQRGTASVRSLRAELWLDLAQVDACGGEALQAMAMLESQQPLEISTGFYSDAVREPGSAYGTPYTEILYNLRPDHLALLPNGIGACNWQSGCGAPRLHGQHCPCPSAQSCTCEDLPMESTPPRGWRAFVQALRAFVTTQDTDHPADEPAEAVPAAVIEAPLTTNQTVSDVQEALYGCLAREMGVNVTPYYIDAGAIDLAGQHFVYRCGERLCRRYWTLVDDVVTLTDFIEDVQRDTTFLPVPDSTGPAEETYPMTMAATPSVIIKTHVQRLIANSAQTGWTENDRHLLEQMDEATLIRLQHQPHIVPPPERHDPTTLSEALDHVPAQFREPLAAAVRTYERHKTSLIKVLMANKQNPFAEEELTTMENDRLEQLVVMAGEPLPEQQPRPLQEQNYAGKRMPQLRIVPDEENQVPPMPKTMQLVVERQRALGLRA